MNQTKLSNLLKQRVLRLSVVALTLSGSSAQAQYWFDDLFSQGGQKKQEEPKKKGTSSGNPERRQEKKKPRTSSNNNGSSGSSQNSPPAASNNSAEEEKFELLQRVPRPKRDSVKLTREQEFALEASLNQAIHTFADRKSKATAAAEELALAKKDYIAKKAMSDAGAKEAQLAEGRAQNAQKKLVEAQARNQKAIAAQKKWASALQASSVAVAVKTSERQGAEVELTTVKGMAPVQPTLPEIPALPAEPKEEIPLPVKKADALADQAAFEALPEDQKAAILEQKRVEQEALEQKRAAEAAVRQAAIEARNAIIAERKSLETKYQSELNEYKTKVKTAEAKLKAAREEESKATNKNQNDQKSLKSAEAELEASSKALTEAESALAQAKDFAEKKRSDSAALLKTTQEAEKILEARTEDSKAANRSRDAASDNLSKIRQLVAEHNVHKARLTGDEIVDLALEVEAGRAEAHYKKKILTRAQKNKAWADKQLAEKEGDLRDSVEKVSKLQKSLAAAVSNLEAKIEMLKQAEAALKAAESEYSVAWSRFKAQEGEWKKANDVYSKAKGAREALEAKAKAQRESAAWYGAKAAKLKKEIETLEAQLVVLRTKLAEAEAKAAQNANDKKLKAVVTDLKTQISKAEKASAEKQKALVVEEKNQVKWSALAETSANEIQVLIANEKVAQAGADKLKAVMDEGKAQGTAKLKVRNSAQAALKSAKSAHDSAQGTKAGTEKSLAKAQQEKTRNEQALAKAQGQKDKADKELSLAERRNAKAQDRYAAAKTSEQRKMELLKKNEGRYEVKSNKATPHEEEMNLYYRASVWPRTPARDYWTDLVIAEIKANFSQLHKARDIEKFCPGYRKVSRVYQNICWLRIFGGIIKYESNFKVDTDFHEVDFGYSSVGLFSMSRNECRYAPTEQMLHNPLLNINCGIGIFARLVAREGCIVGPGDTWKACGASKYWAVLNTRRQVGKYKMGSQTELIAIASKYRDFK